MARQFVGASTQYLSRTGAVVTAAPLTMAGFFRNPAGGSGALCYLDNVTTGSNRLGLLSNGVGVAPSLQIQDSGGTGNVSATATVASADTWYHLAGVFTSTTDRRIYFEGGNDAQSVASVSPTLTDTHLGILNLGGATFVPLTGMLAEWAIWDVALTAPEIVALSKGFSPLLIRPTSLVAYWPLFGNDATELDRSKSRFDLTLTNAPTKADHPRIYYPTGAMYYPRAAAAAPASTGNMLAVF